MVRPTLINLSPVELKHYLFMLSLNKYTGSCNATNMCSKRNTRHK